MSTTTIGLYCPGDRPDRFQKALDSGADFIILDLEDSVSKANKHLALDSVVEFLNELPEKDKTRLEVRVNRLNSEKAALKKFENWLSVRLPELEQQDQLDNWSNFNQLTPLIETSYGMQNINDIAKHPKIKTLAIGETDLMQQLGASHPAILTHFRIQLINASAAHGLPRPMMSAWTQLSDPEGFFQDCLAGKSMGFAGRTVIHPDQVPIARKAFSETDQERAKREEIAELMGEQGGVARDSNGDMIDSAHTKQTEN